MRTSCSESVRRFRWLLAACVAGLSIVAAGCGSSSSGGSSSASGGQGASTGAVAAAKKAMDQAMQRPSRIPISTPVGKPIPTGKRIVYIACGVPLCQSLAKQFTAGADVLGWQVTQVNAGATPTDIQQAWEQAIRARPDAVVSSGTSSDVIAQQLAALRRADIPVVEEGIVSPLQDPVKLIVDAPKLNTAVGTTNAAWVAADSGGDAHTLYVNVPAYPIIQRNLVDFKRHYAVWCKGCGLDELSLPLTSLGNDSSERIVSYLRAHPDVDHVVLSIDQITVGLPNALKSAGLQDKVKLIGDLPTVQNYEYLATGQQAASVSYHTDEAMWTEVDALARLFTGQSVKPDNVALPYMLLTKSNLPSSSHDFPLVVDYQAQFKKLWGKG